MSRAVSPRDTGRGVARPSEAPRRWTCQGDRVACPAGCRRGISSKMAAAGRASDEGEYRCRSSPPGLTTRFPTAPRRNQADSHATSHQGRRRVSPSVVIDRSQVPGPERRPPVRHATSWPAERRRRRVHPPHAPSQLRPNCPAGESLGTRRPYRPYGATAAIPSNAARAAASAIPVMHWSFSNEVAATRTSASVPMVKGR